MSKAFIQKPAPEFDCQALLPDGTFGKVNLSSRRGRWVVLFFYPLDFTFVCPTEICQFSDRVEEFTSISCDVIASSIDSEFCHLAWTQQPRKQGGLGPMKIPILADVQKSVASDYGVLLDGVALRGTFIIDPAGNLRHYSVNDFPIGRSVDEVLRLVKALQFHAIHGEVCPAGWQPGKPTMKDDPAASKKYFGAHA